MSLIEHAKTELKTIGMLGSEDESVVPEPSCVVNISKEYYMMMDSFTATN